VVLPGSPSASNAPRILGDADLCDDRRLLRSVDPGPVVAASRGTRAGEPGRGDRRPQVPGRRSRDGRCVREPAPTLPFRHRCHGHAGVDLSDGRKSSANPGSSHRPFACQWPARPADLLVAGITPATLHPAPVISDARNDFRNLQDEPFIPCSVTSLGSPLLPTIASFPSVTFDD